MAEWRPWRALRERPEIEMVLADLPAGIRALHVCDGEDRAILINRSLSPGERLAALAHELVHDERCGGAHHPGAPDSWAPVVARDEAAVDRIVASRLVPADRLAALVEQLIGLGEGVSALEVAEHFGVPEEVALRALRLLDGHAA